VDASVVDVAVVIVVVVSGERSTTFPVIIADVATKEELEKFGTEEEVVTVEEAIEEAGTIGIVIESDLFGTPLLCPVLVREDLGLALR